MPVIIINLPKELGISKEDKKKICEGVHKAVSDIIVKYNPEDTGTVEVLLEAEYHLGGHAKW